MLTKNEIVADPRMELLYLNTKFCMPIYTCNRHIGLMRFRGTGDIS